MTDPEITPISQMLLDLAEGLTPLLEAGKGFRAKVIADGASDETADAVYREFMICMIRSSLK